MPERKGEIQRVAVHDSSFVSSSGIASASARRTPCLQAQRYFPQHTVGSESHTRIWEGKRRREGESFTHLSQNPILLPGALLIVPVLSVRLVLFRSWSWKSERVGKKSSPALHGRVG